MTLLDFMPILLYFLESSSCLTWLNYDYPLWSLWLLRKIKHDFLWLAPDFPIKTLRKILQERPERLEPATLSFTGKCVNQWAMRNFNKCWWKYEAFIGKKSQWKTSGERAVVMKSQDIKSKFGSSTWKVRSPVSIPWT